MSEDVNQSEAGPAASPKDGPPPAPTSAAAPDKSADLSSEIVTHVERQPGDVVKCTRISGDRYRCNWWAPEATGAYDNPGMTGLLVTTHRVRQSRFLRVTRLPTGRLVIKNHATPNDR